VFIPTNRLLVFALAGIIPVALTGSTSLSIYVAILWAAVAIGVGVLDGLMTPRRDELQWRREHDAKLYLGAWNRILLHLENRSGRPATFRLRDVTPPVFRVDGSEASGSCRPGSSTTIDYRVMPMHRGAYRLGPLAVRLLGPLGLSWRQRRWPAAEPVKVYPNLLAIRSYESLARRGHLQEIGVRNARRFGGGTEFDQLRDYGPDDDYRRINWKATARTGRVISTVYRTERAQNVVLVLDAGRLMTTPVRPEGVIAGAGPRPALTRFDHAVNAALLLSFVAQQTGDRTGLLCFGDQIIRYLPPRPGRRSFLSITHAIHDIEPELNEPDYGMALRYLAARNTQRSLVVLFTDVTEPEAASPLIQGVQYLARRHLCLVVTMRDPDLERLATVPPTETKHVYERAVARTVLDNRERTLRLLRDRGVLSLDAIADKISAEAVNRYLEIKARHLL
jgi:uncharacterized protein (DUF58 family)